MHERASEPGRSLAGGCSEQNKQMQRPRGPEAPVSGTAVMGEGQGMSVGAPTGQSLVRHGKTPDFILRMRRSHRRVSSRKETSPGLLDKTLSGCRVEHRFKRARKRQEIHVGTRPPTPVRGGGHLHHVLAGEVGKRSLIWDSP